MAVLLEEKNIYSGFKKFVSFLKKEDIINLGIGFILATAINNFLLIFIDSIMMPFVNRMFGPESSTNMPDASTNMTTTPDTSDTSNNNIIKFKNRTFNILGINFGIGQFVIGMIQFCVILYIVYLISLISI